MNGADRQDTTAWPSMRDSADHPAGNPDIHPDVASCLDIGALLGRVGDKWTVLVAYSLRDGPRRFNMLRRHIAGISQRMLTHTLRGLERDGLITRTVIPMVPPRVEYALTPLGQSFLEPVQALGRWAWANQTVINDAQRAFDARMHDGRDT